MTTKKNQLITTAFELFYYNGIHAVGINKILEVSGIAKKTLYNHFQSKEELIEATLTFRDVQYRNWLYERVNEAPKGIERIHALFDALDDWFNNRVCHFQLFRGCFFINTSAEFGDPSTKINQVCVAHKTEIRRFIKTQVSELNIQPHHLELITDSIQLLKEGAITIAAVQEDCHIAEKAKKSALLIIDAYSNSAINKG